VININAFEQALRPHTRLTSVMMANNEIGVLQPIAAVARLASERGIVFHTDAAQAVGKVPVDVGTLGVDLLSFTAHKIYGPKGIGALYVRRRRPKLMLAPLIDGGGHEHGLRSGTINVPGAVGFGAAAEICGQEMTAEASRVAVLRDRLLDGLTNRVSGVTVNGSMSFRLPHNLNTSFEGLEGESLLVGLDDVAISSGAACTSANPETSHVLRAISVPDELARASIRFGLGRSTTGDEVDYVVNKVGSLVTRLRELSPHGAS
jgi:cysteine desulfurase